MAKVFDIVIKSKYTPEGVRGLLGGLKEIGETGFFIQQGLVQPLQDVAGSVLNLIELSNPERIGKLKDAFEDIEVAAGGLLDRVLGPMVDTLTDIARVGAEALGFVDGESITKFYKDIADEAQRAGGGIENVVNRLLETESALQEGLASSDHPFAKAISQGAERGAESTEAFRQTILQSAGSLTEYINGLDLLGIKYSSLAEEVERFNEAHGRVAPTFRDIIAAQNEFVSGIAAIGEERLQLEERIGVRLGDMLMDQAIRRSDAQEDQARRNARTLADISRQRIDAIQQASEDLTSDLADIQDDSARNRIKIEERFQERIRQIKTQFGDQIEEAIRRRDARGLASALKGQKDQLGQATRDRDTQARDRALDTSDRQKEAQERQKEQEAQAEEAAERAQEQLAKQTKIANEERERGFKRQQRNQDISFDRLRRDRSVENVKEITDLRRQNTRKIREVNRYFDEIENIIDKRLAVGGKLMELISTAVVDTLSTIFGAP